MRYPLYLIAKKLNKPFTHPRQGHSKFIYQDDIQYNGNNMETNRNRQSNLRVLPVPVQIPIRTIPSTMQKHLAKIFDQSIIIAQKLGKGSSEIIEKLGPNNVAGTIYEYKNEGLQIFYDDVEILKGTIGAYGLQCVRINYRGEKVFEGYGAARGLDQAGIFASNKVWEKKLELVFKGLGN